MKKYIAWCCDYENKTGEGRLARKFIDEKIRMKKIKILKPKFKFYLSNYFYQFYGIFIMWYFFLKGWKVIYVNYLPLWNSCIFLLCPPTTIFGPITGSIQINKLINFKSIIRLCLFPILYKFSVFILRIRRKKIIFATNILIKYFKKNKIKNYEFNFVLNNFKLFPKLSKNKKKYYLIIYYRKYNNKFFEHHKIFIYDLIKRNKKIVVVGDNLNIPGTINLGKKNKKQLDMIIKQSSFCLSGDDNLLSFFNIDCLKNRVKIIYNYKLKYQIPKSINKLFVPYNYKIKSFI
tara:strand:- start:349 stop:1218 length:870 start_codon:yes stop_codon:yes gene_type:complete